MSMWSNTDVKPLKTFLRKWPNTRILTYFGAQNGQEIGRAFEAHIVHISESNSNASSYKARLVWIKTKLFNKIFKNLDLTHLGAQNDPTIWASGAYLLDTYKNSSNALVKQFSSEFSRNFSRK